jgi:hypothetical protein
MAMKNGKMPVQCEICGKTVLKKGLKKHHDMAHGKGQKYAFSGVSNLSDFKNGSEKRVNELEGQVTDVRIEQNSTNTRFPDVQAEQISDVQLEQIEQITDLQNELILTKTRLSQVQDGLESEQKRVYELETQLAESETAKTGSGQDNISILADWFEELTFADWIELGKKKAFFEQILSDQCGAKNPGNPDICSRVLTIQKGVISPKKYCIAALPKAEKPVLRVAVSKNGKLSLLQTSRSGKPA